MKEQVFERPFPALTPEQRYYLDVYGYAIIPNTLNVEEIGNLKEVLQKLKRDLQACPDPKTARVRGATMIGVGAHRAHLGTIIEVHPAIMAYAAHPRLVGMAEELIGGEARICELNAIINSRDPRTYQEAPNYGFHNGIDVPYGSHIKNGLYHCKFVKTLTNLTELGPEDGGTVVIAGSHKIDLPVEQQVEAAKKDPKLVHQVVAPAGSTLLFSETLIHGTGQIRSENQRMLIICGYAASHLPYWEAHQMSEEFTRRVPPALKTLVLGRAHWTRGARYRTLDQAVDTRPYRAVEW